jgi:anti-anti-sigma factor
VTRTISGTSSARGTGIGVRTMDIVHDGQTLWLSGDFDVRSTMEVRSAIYEHLDGFEQDLTVDLTDVETLDITAARVLAYATIEASRGGHHLRVRGCGPAVRRMLQLSRLARFIEVERAAASA